MSTLTLQNDLVGAIAYKLIVNGEIEEVITAEDAIEYLHGAENIIFGLEEALEGKKAGDAFAITISSDKGYGDYDEEEVDAIPLEEFALDTSDLQVGEEIELWSEEDDDIFEAMILEITDTYIKLDFNHPLAGKSLDYDVQVVDVREATPEEIEMGVPQSIMTEMLAALESEDEADDEFYSLNHKE